MPTKRQTSTNGQVHDLSGFRLPPVYEWVECELPDVNEGLTRPLKIEVLVNPARAEVIALTHAIDDVLRRSRERQQTLVDAATAAREAGEPVPPVSDPAADEAEDRELAHLIAPRIRAWNVQAENGDGELVDLWPPAEAPDVLLLLGVRQRRWVWQLVQAAHLGGETRSKLSRPREVTASGAAEKTPSGPQIVDTPTGATHQNRPTSS